MVRVLLASGSPRRVALCKLAGITCELAPVDIAELLRAGEDPRHYVERLARQKAEAALARVPQARIWAIGADTIVVTAGRCVLGKPRNRRDAKRMLVELCGCSHRVLTGLCVMRQGGPRRIKTVETTVVLCAATDSEIEACLDTEEWRDKAGAYAIQGAAGARFVSRIVGSYTNVMGLPTVELIAILREFDVL